MSGISFARAHFVGIGGSGMSGIARIMAARGLTISGSDQHESTLLDGLRALGVTIYIGHDRTHLGDTEVLIRSSAIADNNVELVAARELGIPIIDRATALALLMDGFKSVAVAGTHGKTTTTSMLTVALQHCRLDPSFAIGASIRNSGTNAHHGSGPHFIVEADESDGSFTAYKPDIAIITNVELDHVDNFKDLESIYSIFREFISSIKPNGTLIACSDDLGVRKLLGDISEIRPDLKTVTYGKEGEPNLKIDRIHLAASEAQARLTLRGRIVGDLNLSIPGEHNLINATAAVAAAVEVGASPSEVLSGIATFTGARRRFEIRGKANGITVVDDYGHHPTEIRATLEVARRYAGSGRLFVIFQPHRYSRTQAFALDFARELSKADHVFLLEIYSAGEKAIPGVTSLIIANKMANVSYEPSMPDVVDRIVATARSGDLILTLGAGDVSNLGPLIVADLEKSS